MNKNPCLIRIGVGLISLIVVVSVLLLIAAQSMIGALPGLTIEILLLVVCVLLLVEPLHTKGEIFVSLLGGLVLGHAIGLLLWFRSFGFEFLFWIFLALIFAIGIALSIYDYVKNK